MRADRLLSIVLLLQQHHQLTAKSLSDRLGVTERTIYRDIEALSMAGVPVYTRTGPEGGCFLDEHYRSSLNWFTTSELQALLYTGTASPLSELGMKPAVDNAILKLLARLPNQQKQIDQMQQRLYLDPSGWYGNHEAYPLLPQLKEAVWGNVVISTIYESWDGIQKSATLYPYSLVYKSGRWYAVAMDADTKAFRTYRVSRFADVTLESDTFERDPDFNIIAYWTEASEKFNQRLPSYPVRLRIGKDMLIYFQHQYAGRYEIVESNDDSYILDVQYMVFEEARTSILGLGTDAEVIAPPNLQKAIIEQAQAIVDKYT